MWYRIARGYGFNPRVREGRDAKAATGAVIKRDGFNPRVREGRDAVEGLHQGWIIVSIHASVKDATQQRRHSARNTSCFNPRVREGRD